MFRRFVLPLFAIAIASAPSPAAPAGNTPSESLAYFLPDEGVTYAGDVPSPEGFFGFSIGDWHLQHHQLLAYYEALAAAAPERVLVEKIGRTHGRRDKILITIMSPENRDRLDDIRAANLGNALGEKKASARAPVVVFLGYSIHGNEPSGANAAPVLAYHLAAGRGEAVDRILANTVVLIDPFLNPDGLDRFAAWTNNHRGRAPNPDPAHREHDEPWPSGRTNTYWFDLNRDWLPAVHPASRAHLDTYHDWRPAVLTDFHEMGTDATYFFQPGVPENANPLIPEGNQELTRTFARFYARALDDIGSLYFTEERFDDFYVGKGSTYPDINGSIGILFEQASARGHTQESPNGPVTLRFGVRNHLRTSLSTLRAAVEHRDELLQHQYKSARSAVREALKSPVRGYVFTAPGDPVLLEKFTSLLDLHRIEYRPLTRDLTVNQIRFPTGESIAVHTDQPAARLITAMFEKRTEFASKAFYDTSAWNIAEAYGLVWTEARESLPKNALGETGDAPAPDATVSRNDDDLALAFAWTHHHASRAAHRLLAAGVRLRVAMTPFTAVTSGGEVAFPAGTIILPFSIQEKSREEILTLAARIAEEDSVPMPGITSGLTPAGSDLGSAGFRPLEQPSVLLVAGDGANPYRTGEVWHLLDRELGLPITLATPDQLKQKTLGRHNVVVFADGRFRNSEDLKSWLHNGGTLIATGSAIRGLADAKLAEFKLAEAEFPEERVAFADAREQSAQKKIAGAILQASLDLTHPVAFGFTRERVALLREGEIFLEPTTNPFASPGLYLESPVVSGFVSEPYQKVLAGSPAVQIHHVGQGRIILFPDAPAYRGYWHGSARLLLNAIFFGPHMKEQTVTIDEE